MNYLINNRFVKYARLHQPLILLHVHVHEQLFVVLCYTGSIIDMLSGMSTNIQIFKYSNIPKLEYFGAGINICIRLHENVHFWVYSNICLVLRIYSNNMECFEQTGCISYGPNIFREHSRPLVYHVSLVKQKLCEKHIIVRPQELGTWNFETMFTFMCDTCEVSCFMCQVSQIER